MCGRSAVGAERPFLITSTTIIARPHNHLDNWNTRFCMYRKPKHERARHCNTWSIPYIGTRPEFYSCQILSILFPSKPVVARAKYPTQLANKSFEKILDLTTVVFLISNIDCYKIDGCWYIFSSQRNGRRRGAYAASTGTSRYIHADVEGAWRG